MATVFDVFYLGTAADIDPTEGNGSSENANTLVGLTYGTATDPLYASVHTFSPGSTGFGGGSATAYDVDNSSANDAFSLDGGADQTMDGMGEYNATLTYADGSTATITATVFQDTAGRLYLAPETTSNPDQAALDAAPLTSITLNSLVDNTSSLEATRVAADFSDGVVDGSAGDDSMGAGYTDGDGDQITGGDDFILAGDGDDTIDGSGGSDQISGQAGDDRFVLTGSFGDDTIIGGEISETAGDTLDLSQLASGATVDLSDADPEAGTVSDGTSTAGFSEIENIILSTGRDTLVLADGSGSDTVTGFDMADSGDGSTADQIDVSALTSNGTKPVNVADVTVSDDGSGSAVLTFPGGEQITLLGVAPGDLDTEAELNAIGVPLALDYVVEGTGGADLIDAGYTGDPDGDKIDNNDAADGSNDDYVEAGDGDDTILTGDGNDSVIAGLGHDSIEGGIGADTIRGGIGDDTIIGGTGDDSLYGNEDADSIIAGDGADSVYGETGDDYIEGGLGDDHLEGNEGADTIHGGAGNDWIRGSYDNDEIWGEEGDDYLWGGFGDDTFHIENNFGNDTVDAEGVAETDGDTLDLSAVTDDLTIDLKDVNPENGTFSDGTSTANFNEIEHIVLGGGRDTLILGDLSGADHVEAFDMTDSGDGTTIDKLDVSALTSDGGTTPVNTDDVAVSDDGSGNAVLSFPGGESITLIGVAPAQLGTPEALASIGIPPAPDHVVEGTGGDDLIDGAYAGDPEGDMIDAGDNAAGTDADSVQAGAGDDTVLAGNADDTVEGGTGADVVHGGAGDDIVTLAEGDSVYGEDGDDTFYVTDYGEAGSNAVTVVGGEGGETVGDTLDFQGQAHWDDVTYTNTDPGAGGGMSGSAVLADGSVVTFSEIENIVICFTAGTRIATATGLREVQELKPGDLVVTRDHGLQPVRWAGRRTVAAQGSLAPIRFAPGVLGNERALLVSPQHRMLVRGAMPNILFGESEVLASAKHMVNGASVARMPGGEVQYVHILFDRHEIVYAEGAPSESFFPGDAGLGAVETAAREELFTLFPELRSASGEFGETARMCLRAHESRLLRLS